MCAIVLFGLISSTQSATPSFKDNAGDFMEVGFKKTIRRGIENKDFTKLEIEARPLLMVNDAPSIDKTSMTLEIKSADEDWVLITKPPSMRGGVYRWTVSNVAPCVQHNVRIWLDTVDGSKNSFTFPETIPAANLDDIIASGYQPEKPEDVLVSHYTGGELKVSWTPSKCSSLYDITYQNVADGTTVSKQHEDTSENSIIISDELVSCSEYEIRVSAIIGDEYSEESIVTFSTQPEQNAVERLQPIITASENSIIAKWKGFEKLSCISEYMVSICKQDEECLTSQKVERDDSLQFIEYKSELILEECTEYILSIKPIHSDIEMTQKSLEFRTKSLQQENVVSRLLPVSADVDDEQMITVNWNSIKCANHYEVFKKENAPEGEWNRVGITEDNYIKIKGVPCTEYKYGIKVTIDDQESDIVEFENLITVSPAMGISDHPSLTIEDRANGSVTFAIYNGDMNHNCKVEQYHIRHNSKENYIDPLTLENGKITLLVSMQDMEIEGRVKFHGYDSWTPWVSSDSPLKEKKEGDNIGFLIPVIIVSVIALLVVSILVFFIIRKKNSQQKYDEEKSQEITEESKKLNKQMEEVINGEKR